MTRVDHLPAVLTIPLRPYRGPKWHRRTRPVCDVAAAQDPEYAQRVVDALKAIPPVSWCSGPDSHAAHLASQVRSAAELAVPRARRPRKDWIKARTWALVRLLSLIHI
eukprot:11885027-Alexandrium_andersonii.AAC.1